MAVRMETCGRALKTPQKLILYLINFGKLLWVFWITSRRKQVGRGLVGKGVCLIWWRHSESYGGLTW